VDLHRKYNILKSDGSDLLGCQVLIQAVNLEYFIYIYTNKKSIAINAAETEISSYLLDSFLLLVLVPTFPIMQLG